MTAGTGMGTGTAGGMTGIGTGTGIGPATIVGGTGRTQAGGIGTTTITGGGGGATATTGITAADACPVTTGGAGDRRATILARVVAKATRVSAAAEKEGGERDRPPRAVG